MVLSPKEVHMTHNGLGRQLKGTPLAKLHTIGTPNITYDTKLLKNGSTSTHINDILRIYK